MDLSTPLVKENKKLNRRSRAAMKALREQIHSLNANGLSRKQIAVEAQCNPSIVTRFLGATKQYRKRGLFHGER
jgi:hypothetical protein